MTVVINGTTGVSGVAGSASTPALIGSDADSGYYINSANEPNASVNGTAVWSAASTFDFKNRIINGNCAIDQYNAGASGTGTNNFPVDRWRVEASQASKWTWGQNLNSVTPPAGFKNYAGISSSSAYSLGANDYFLFTQAVEGYNVADFGFGASGAATFTLSFWVRSSLTGTFSGSLMNSSQNRCYVFTYTVNSANTWEQKTITVAGDTTGTWQTTTSAGLNVRFSLGVGSNFSTSSTNTWVSSQVWSSTGSTNVMGTSGATWYITGVQLEKGSTATSFDFRDYGRELIMCQRYYEVSGTTGNDIFWSGNTVSGVTYFQPVRFAVTKRAAPSPSNVGTPSNNGFPNTLNMDSASISGFRAYETSNASVNGGYFRNSWQASAEL